MRLQALCLVLSLGVIGCDAPSVVVVAADAGAAGDAGAPGDAASHQRSSAVDAGAADVDAGFADAGAADAGTDAGAAASTADAGTRVGAGPKLKPPKVLSIYNRVLVKPTDPKATPRSITSQVERLTGASVSAVRVTARRHFLVEMAPTEPKRTQEAQVRLVTTLRKSPAFASVEADRLMQLR